MVRITGQDGKNLDHATQARELAKGPRAEVEGEEDAEMGHEWKGRR